MNSEIRNIFDASSLIKIDEIEKKLNEKSDKKIYCFGGGSVAEILMRELLYKYNIVAFLDNKTTLWGNQIGSVEIMNPQVLCQENKDEVFILVVSRHYDAISEQLEEYGLLENVNFIDAYNQFEPYFLVKRMESSAERFDEFINRIPEDLFQNIPVNNSVHIGIVCMASMIEYHTWYAMALFMVLKLYKYDVTLIVDEMNSCDDIVYFEQCTDIAKLYIEYVLKRLQLRFNDLDIRYIDDCSCADLDIEDSNEVKRLTNVACGWQLAQPNRLKENLDIQKEFASLFEHNMKRTKAFFSNNSFDTINVISGAKTRGLYIWEGKRHEMRVSTYDGCSAPGHTLFSSDGMSPHYRDIVRTIKEGYCNEELTNLIIQKAKNNFKSRISATSKESGYNFQQSIELTEGQKLYDIVMPLNINCDMAALGVDDIFKDESDWIFATVDYILNETDATIMVREHPAMLTNVWKGYKIKRYNNEFAKRYGNMERVFFCEAEQSINTYRMIERAKLVLPYSSTVGIESSLLGKPVIVHTNVYYSKLNCVYKANSREEYFACIKKALDGELTTNKNMVEAYLAYYGLMSSCIKTEFTERKSDWMKFELSELVKQEGVSEIVDIIAEGKPSVYINFQKQ